MTAWRVAAALSAVTAVGLVVAARRRFLVIDVVGDSMAPAYRDGDRVLVRRTRRFRRGDVVIARHQEGGGYLTSWLVKRLVALPGDPVPESVLPATGTADLFVPAGMTVLIGDHPGSADSRSWGFIPMTDLAGVVVQR
ncbi:S26 family signal peptidase [Paractinoplanes rishiriensis]|uniref:Peptidase S26 domain-containing protein n=1 Tax=Paractinoplanes rishiriensis TaxID=1050105 RepID=A0A919K5A7_9ACTN|nr:S26 family signal peptidase [Actinoplanes rishiriensis]GIE99572.1 hypothetical protein Ari01nite_70370 [Actinoplanes rishiriensis]